MKITAKMIKLSIPLVAVLLASLVARQNDSNKTQTQSNLSRTHKQEFSDSIPDIIPDHPRLLLRPAPWSHGPNLADLKAASATEPWKAWLKKRPGGHPTEGWAFRYLLTQDESLIPRIINHMKTVKYWPGYLATVAICYDWIYHSPSFSASDKATVEKRMVDMAEQAIKKHQAYNDMWSHFGYRPPVDIALTGLALWGHRPEAEKYIQYGGEYIRNNLLPGWQRTGGAYQGGWVYYSQGVQALVEFVAAWSSATDQNLYEEIATKQNNWLLSHMYYLIYSTLPDKSLTDTAGFSYTPALMGTKSVLMIASAYKNRDGIQYLRWIGGDLTSWRYDWWPYLFFSPELRSYPDGAYQMPLTKIWGRDGVGYVQMREGWGENNSVIEFNCGDYFWSHSFLDQNSFTIFRNGRLAIQSGVYADSEYGGPYMTNYYRRTISSNSILVDMPGERFYYYGKYFNEPGGQREIYLPPPGGNPETCLKFSEYLSRLNSRNHFETGTIEAFETTDRYSYVRGNATMAYNNPKFAYPGNKAKLDLFTRQMVFLDRKYLLIHDRVHSVDPEYDKRWLLHSIGQPQFTDYPIHVSQPGHHETFRAGVVRINHEGGTLFCKTLFPEDYVVVRVGGSATVTPASPALENKGSAFLRTSVSGIYSRLSPSIASDSAQKEDWTIEFIDDQHFRIKGSVTGEDGSGSIKDAMFISKSQSIFIPKDNWEGTPIKGDIFYFSVTSPSFRFWANGENQIPHLKSLYKIIREGSKIDPGNWRIEVLPKKKERANTFLHFLYPCDRNQPAPPLCEDIATINETMKGAILENWIVFFGNRSNMDGVVKYGINKKAKMANLLLDMKPGEPFTVSIDKGMNTMHKQNLTASMEGTLFFTVTGPCLIEISSP